MTDLQGMTKLFAMLQSMNTKLNSGGPLDRSRRTGVLLHAAVFAQAGRETGEITEAHTDAQTIAMSASIGEA